MKKLISAAALLALTSAGSVHADDADDLTIGSSLGYAPFEYVDADGNPTGIDIELAQAAAKALGKELQIDVVPFASQIPSLMSNRIEIAWSSFTVTQERLEKVDFVTFLQSGATISLLPQNAEKYPDPDSACGMNLAIQVGAAADQRADQISAECAAKGLPEMEKTYYPENKDVIQAVLTGRVDGTLGDATAAKYYAQQSKGKLAVVPFLYSPTELGLAVRKGDTATAEMMQKALQTLIDDGTYSAILSKYNQQDYGVATSRIITDAGQLTQ